MTIDSSTQHFVLTRFNVRLPWLSRHDAERRFEDPAWLRRRIELFERYCLPSVRQQTCRQFRWLVFVDSQSPDMLRQRMRVWRKQVRQLETVFMKQFHSRSLRRRLVERLPADCSRVITTRFDSDDMLGPRFVQTVQQIASDLDFGMINLQDGYQYCQGRLYRYADDGNPFSSCVADAADEHCILSFDHTRLTESGPVLNVTGGRHWLQMIHGGNVACTLKFPEQRCPLLLPGRQFPGLLRDSFQVRGVTGLLQESALALKWITGGADLEPCPVVSRSSDSQHLPPNSRAA